MAALTLLIVLLVAFAQGLWLPLLHLLNGLLAPHGGLVMLLIAVLVSWLLLGDGDVADPSRRMAAASEHRDWPAR